MGGSGGGSQFPSREAGTGCDITFETDVFGVVPEHADQISKGDVLSIDLISKGSSSHTVAVNLNNGKQLGSIAAGSKHLSTLVSCLQKGVAYKAKVIKIDSSQITIRVSQE